MKSELSKLEDVFNVHNSLFKNIYVMYNELSDYMQGFMLLKLINKQVEIK